MNLLSTLPGARASADPEKQGNTRLSGYWLVLARILWLAIFLLMLVVFCANLLAGRYSLVPTILIVTNTSIWFIVSLVLFWRKSHDRAILQISLLLTLTGGFFFPPIPLALWNYTAWRIPINALGLLAGATLTFAYTFPDGHFVPGFTRWLSLGWIAVSLVPVPTLGTFYPWHWWLSPLYTLIRLAFYVSIACALLYRYRRMSTPVQQQQIKWVIFVLTFLIVEVILTDFVVTILPIYFPALRVSTQLHLFISSIAFYLLPACFPLSIGIAFLRYRLWDLDLIIKRTLLYGLLSLLLALVYFGLVLSLEFLESLFTGQLLQSPTITVFSTLIIAGLFYPLRRGIQQAIDHRFYRSRYDAARTLEAFSTTLHNELDLDQLHEQLLEVVQKTMHPTFVSLWLQPREYNRTKQDAWKPTFSASSNKSIQA
ncbi:MAG TPA: hypothetical protein VGD98_19165 [Ktedonobacteraceae bacterium]